MSFKYILGLIISIPLIPLLYLDGKKIRRKVPALPEAENPCGYVTIKSEKAISILFIGESTLAGVGIEQHVEGVPGTLATMLSERLNTNVLWKVYAKSGYTIKEKLEIIIPSITETSADLIVIGTGGNDAFTINTPWKFRRTTRKMIEELQSRFVSTPIAFLNMPPIKVFPAFTSSVKFVIGNLVEILGDELEKEVKNHDKVYYASSRINTYNWLNDSNYSLKDFFSDGVHPSKLTYQLWAKDFARFLLEHNVISS